MKLTFSKTLALLLISFLVSRLAWGGVSTGTGFFISSNGYVATNYHVVADGKTFALRDGNGNVHEAHVVLRDTSNDLAILKVEGSSFVPLPIRSSNSIKKGAAVFTLGFPNVTIQGRESKVTEGIVSSLSGFDGQPNSFQISVPIQPGNSGGPLIDMTGAVLGLTTSKLSAAAMINSGRSIPENVNYAVKSNYLLELIGTDRNIARAVSLSQPSASPRPLTELVERAEQAVVFVLVDANRQTLPKTGSGGQSGSVPKYEGNAQAADIFQRGKAAYERADFQEAIVSLRKAADLGHAEAAFLIGWMYQNGKGVAKDYGEAERWHRRAAEQGFPQSQSILGFMLANGVGVSKDETQAIHWLRKAAEQGYAEGQYNLGWVLANASGVPKDEAEAVRWYRRAAEQGYPQAQYNLGNMYRQGRGVPMDEAEAARWYRTAAEQGYARAQYNLAFMLANGRGVPKDEAEAVRWYRKAADQGLDPAKDALRRLGF